MFIELKEGGRDGRREERKEGRKERKRKERKREKRGGARENMKKKRHLGWIIQWIELENESVSRTIELRTSLKAKTKSDRTV